MSGPLLLLVQHLELLVSAAMSSLRVPMSVVRPDHDNDDDENNNNNSIDANDNNPPAPWGTRL